MSLARIAFALAQRVPAPIQRRLRPNRYAVRLLRPLTAALRSTDVVIAEGPRGRPALQRRLVECRLCPRDEAPSLEEAPWWVHVVATPAESS